MGLEREGQAEMCAPIMIDGVNVIPLQAGRRDILRPLYESNYKEVAEQIVSVDPATTSIPGLAVNNLLPYISEDLEFNLVFEFNDPKYPEKDLMIGAIDENNSVLLASDSRPDYLNEIIKKQESDTNMWVAKAVAGGAIAGDVIYRMASSRRSFVRYGLMGLAGAALSTIIPAGIQSVASNLAYKSVCKEGSREIKDVSQTALIHDAISIRKQAGFCGSPLAREMGIDNNKSQVAVLPFDHLGNIPEIERIIHDPYPFVVEELVKETKYLQDNTSLSAVEINQQVADKWLSMATTVPMRIQRGRSVPIYMNQSGDKRNVWIDNKIIGFDTTGMTMTDIYARLGRNTARLAFDAIA